MSLLDDVKLVRKNFAMTAAKTKADSETRKLEREFYDAISRIESSTEVKVGSQLRFAVRTLRELREKAERRRG